MSTPVAVLFSELQLATLRQLVDTFVIQQGSIYRTCVPSDDRRRTYCVIVKTNLPFARSVSFAGYESNEVLNQGAQ